MTEQTERKDLLAVHPDLFESERNTVIDAQDRFKAKKDTWLQGRINEEVDRVGAWFKENFPEDNLKVNVIFDTTPDELEIRRTITYKAGHSFNSIISSDVIEPRIWNNPYLMDNYVQKFFEIQKNRITGIMFAKDKGIIA